VVSTVWYNYFKITFFFWFNLKMFIVIPKKVSKSKISLHDILTYFQYSQILVTELHFQRKSLQLVEYFYSDKIMWRITICFFGGYPFPCVLYNIHFFYSSFINLSHFLCLLCIWIKHEDTNMNIIFPTNKLRVS